jgi:hypothetical protein
MKGTTIFALLGVCLAPATAFAQQTPGVRSVPVGFHTPATAPTNAKALVLDVSTGTPTRVVRNIVIGTIGGAAVGALIGYSTNKQGKEDRELAALRDGILGASVGALVGAVIAVTHKNEAWPASLIH